jgi:hypothetical protein
LQIFYFLEILAFIEHFTFNFFTFSHIKLLKIVIILTFYKIT